MKKPISFVLALVLCLSLFACTKTPAAPDINGPAANTQSGTVSKEEKEKSEAPIPEGLYLADFNTDGSMFHVNEAYNGKGLLTVKDGKMTIHIALPSKNTVNLFRGTAEDAQKEGAELIDPTVETVLYEDGTTSEVNTFDVPVPCLDDEFDCALVGTKGKWYDHKVSVSNPVSVASNEAGLKDGSYTMEVTLVGGSGRASVNSPAIITVEDGKMYAEIIWSSSHYEYMKIGDVQYDPVNTEGNSTFKIPVSLDGDMSMNVSALTTAMSEPHLIDYELHFDLTTFKPE